MVVAAVGKRNVLTADMVKPGAVVIDVGMNRNDEGKLCGDVDFAGVREVAGWITPVPGGVGPMTITMLLVNTLEAAERAADAPALELAACRQLPSEQDHDQSASRLHDLPLFDQIRPEHVAPAVDALLAEAETALQTVTAPDFPADWIAISKVLDVASERFGRAWGAVGHLNAVADTPELRAAYNDAMPRVTAFWTRLGSDERLYAKYKAIDPATLNAEQRQAHRNAVRNFVLGGAELQGEAKKRFAEIQERQAELSQKFSENALDATDAFA